MGIWHLTKKFQFNLDTSKKQSPNFIPLLCHRLPFHSSVYIRHAVSAYISWHSHQTLFKVFSSAAIVYFGYFRHHARFQAFKSCGTLHIVFIALSSTAGYLLTRLRQPSHPARIFSGIFRIRFVYCRLDDCDSRNFGLV